MEPEDASAGGHTVYRSPSSDQCSRCFDAVVPCLCCPDECRSATPAAHSVDRIYDALVYGVPKVALGMDISDDPTDEVKADQKDFFRLLYRLLVGADRGPRLPTLIVALGGAKVRSLLTAG